MKTGTVATTWAPAARLDLRRLKAQLFVWRGAVRYGATTAAVTGEVRQEHGVWVLEASGTRQRFRLVAPPGASPASAAWNRLAARPAGARVRIAGEVREGQGEELTLVVQDVEALPAR